MDVCPKATPTTDIRGVKAFIDTGWGGGLGMGGIQSREQGRGGVKDQKGQGQDRGITCRSGRLGA